MDFGVLAQIISIIAATTALGVKIKSWINKDVTERLDRVDMQQTKNFLVRTLADLERDVALTETEKERLKEQYDHYISKGGNSYIKDKYDALKKGGKI